MPNGTCAPVLVGNDPRGDCGEDQSCNGGGACGYVGPGTCNADSECVSGFCRNNTCCISACEGPCMSCSAALNGIADGICSATSSGLEVGDECTGPTACNGGGGCYNSAPGIACSENSECATGICNSACCNAPCDGVCEICTTGNGGGQCTLVANGADPRNECPGGAVCDGTGRCSTATTGTPCNDDSGCFGGICCDRQCHWWTDLRAPVSSGEVIDQVYGLGNGNALVVVEYGSGTQFMTRLLAYNGAAWSDTGVFQSGTSAGRFDRVVGSRETQVVAIAEGLFQSHPTMYRFDGTTWSSMLVPTWPVGSALVIDNATLYLSTTSAVYRWQAGAFEQVTLPGYVRPFGMLASIDGATYALSLTTAGTAVIPLKVDELTATSLNWSIQFNDTADVLVGVDGAPSYVLGYVAECQCNRYFKLTSDGLTAISLSLNTLLQTRPAIAGPGSHLFVAGGAGVQWSFDQKTYKTTSLPDGDVVSVSSGASCSAFAATEAHVYSFQ